MDKQAYKDMIAEYMKRESELKTKVEELELKLDQQSQDFHFDMRNKQMEMVVLQNRLDTLIQGFDDLEKENKELRKTIGEQNE
jgi:hypothetical protein